MSAGKELDALIAERIFKYDIKFEDAEYDIDVIQFVNPGDILVFEKNIFRGQLKNYSTNIASAWEVIDKFESLSIHKGVLLNSINKQLEGKGVWDKGYKCEIVVDMPNFKTVCAIGTTAPEAICRAALLATLELPK